MSRDLEVPLTIHTLYDGPNVSVSDYNCRAFRGGPAAEEYVDSHKIVLLRHGVFCKHVGRQSLTADVNQAVFFAKGSTYRVSHPVDCGDRGTVFTLAPQVLSDILCELDPAYADHPDQPFPFDSGPCESGVFWSHRQLLRRLEAANAQPLDPMWVDETALHMMAEILAGAFARYGEPQKRRRNGTLADHTERAEAAKSYLAGRMGEPITLDDVARHVHTSAFHLSRIFRQHTGMPVHRYLTRLRLRASLEQLADGMSDLTALALELGYSSHSHFTDTFRRELGRTPSDVRKVLSHRTHSDLSKNPEA
ncbi:MAG: AraC family transcriptional regulator [Holophagales bacterium]|nr:AraC family transcriptional regulator [Holophagales bacterium]